MSLYFCTVLYRDLAGQEQSVDYALEAHSMTLAVARARIAFNLDQADDVDRKDIYVVARPLPLTPKRI